MRKRKKAGKKKMARGKNNKTTNNLSIKDNEKREEDLKIKSKSFFSNHPWLSNMLSAFVATVLGIAVTFGISKLTEEARNKEIIKASVFNALSDLDNYEKFLRHDDSIFAEINWLPQVINQFYRKDSIDKDSIFKKINYCFGYRNHFKDDYKPIGKEYLNQCQIENVKDLEAFRIINIAYEDALLSYSFLEKMNMCVDELNNVWLGMYFSHKRYTHSDVVNMVLSHNSAYKLCLMMNEKFIFDGESMGFFDYYIKKIEFHRQRILLFAGTNMAEYNKYKEERIITNKNK